MKGSAITGPVGKEAAELWPVSSSPSFRLTFTVLTPLPSVLPATPVSSCKVLACERESRKDKRACGAWWLGFCPECDQIERGKETSVPPLPPKNLSYLFPPLPTRIGKGAKNWGEGCFLSKSGQCSFYLLLLKSLDLAQTRLLHFGLRRVRMIHIPGIHIKDKTKVTSIHLPLGVVFFLG